MIPSARCRVRKRKRCPISCLYYRQESVTFLLVSSGGRWLWFIYTEWAVPISFYFNFKYAEVNKTVSMGPQSLLGYVNILSSTQLYAQHGRCHSLSKIRKKRKGSKPDTRMAEEVFPQPQTGTPDELSQFWGYKPWLGSTAWNVQRTYSVILSLLTLVFHRKTTRSVRNNTMTAQLRKLKRMALSSSLSQSTERVWQWPRSQTLEKTQLGLNLGSATSYPQAVSLGKTSYWSYPINVHFLTCHLIFEIN